MNKFRLFIAGILLLIPAMMFAQMQVSGTVTDATTGDPLPGVGIVLVGTGTGTSTDFDGNFIMDDVPSGSVLEFSYLGFKTQQVTVTGNKINVQMEEDAEALGEVVVIGYGTAKKEDLTGSVNIVTTKDFNKGAVTSAQQLITGKIAGVSVTPPGGAPGEAGNINIRGLSSISLENTPLYVLDGFPLDNSGVGGSRNILDLINPSDIESIVVLKDASATAIYGSRAANGVIMITTKKGKDKKLKFSYSTKASIYHPYDYVDMMTADEFRGVVESIGTSEAIGRLGNADTDWQKVIYQNAIGFDHDLTATGNLAGIPVRASIGYNKQEGILKTDDFKRTSASLSMTPSLLDDYLKFEINIRGAKIKNQFADQGAIGNAIRFDPTQPVYDTDSPFEGYYTWLVYDSANDQYNQMALAPTNPLAMLNLRDNHSTVNRFIGNIKMDYKLQFFPDIVGTVNLGYEKSKGEGINYRYPYYPTTSSSRNPENTDYSDSNTNKLFDGYLTYDKDISQHHLKVAVGTSYQKLEKTRYSDYINQALTETITDDPTNEVLISYFGRLNFDFSNKFLLTGTFRADASSKLNPKDRWGYFPSAAIAWNIHNEKFMENSKFDELKLRVGYGEVGNVNGLQPYLYLQEYIASTNTAYYQLGDAFYQTYRPKPFNDDIRWEVGQTLNAGLDFAALSRRVSGSLNVYRKVTQDLIVPALIDPFTNFGNEVNANIGDMENKGVELELALKPVQKENVQWDINYNIAFNDNKITKLEFELPWGGIEGGVGNNVQVMREGESPYAFNVYEQVYDEAGKPIEGVYVDRNNDGIINNSDKYIYKDPFADIQMGLTTTFKYKNFDVTVTTRSNIGNYVYDNVASSKAISYDINAQQYLSNLHTDYFNAGFQSYTETNFLSDYYVTDASFVKIDNITAGLNFDQFLRGIDLRVFGTVQNVATFTKYKGLDPEVFGGIDNNFYPRPRTVTFGFNLDF